MRVIQRDGEAPDLALEVRRRPSGDDERPVLLVHGMGGDHGTWRRVASVLRAAGRSTIAVDLRGHGHSQRARRYGLGDFADDLGAVLDDLAVPRVDVVAHSLGAHSALRLAMTRPDRVGRLVLEEPPPMPQSAADLEEKVVPAFAGLGDRLRGIRAVVTSPMTLVRFDRTVPDQVGRQFERVDTDWWDGLGALSAPVLVVSGGERSFLAPRHLRRIADVLPNGEFTTIPSSHSVHRDRPREFTVAVRRHLLG
ncbi:alpha/beta hydrolase [Gordonia sp. PP30]|uniref:alpha/beta fold hydrolase n=1 Tax=Gordonia sp. PP30 TaxID=2935861 RepID=UPI001FFE5019|nr:alpha/beta hydrolase [Gordonia sp. PP30]UQE74483.1 alpha/beta hydrolase [Gordonia sp. PP30]